MKYVMTVAFVVHCVITATASANPTAKSDGGSAYVPCVDSPSRYKARSDELQRLAAADQADRPAYVLKPRAQLRDRERRQRVGAIFGEGCFKEARDFAAAALVFQHGDRPDHFFQAYVWAKRAIELGDRSQRGLMLMAIDRYLVNSGHKQLFATQFNRPTSSQGSCWCLVQTERNFPDTERLKHGGKPFQQKLEHLTELNQGLSCPLVECSEELAATPPGSVPGLC